MKTSKYAAIISFCLVVFFLLSIGSTYIDIAFVNAIFSVLGFLTWGPLLYIVTLGALIISLYTYYQLRNQEALKWLAMSTLSFIVLFIALAIIVFQYMDVMSDF